MRTVLAPMIFAEAVKNERPKSADNTSRKGNISPSPIPMEGIPMEGIQTTTVPLQYVAQIFQISLAILLLCKPAIPTRCHTASSFAFSPRNLFPKADMFPVSDTSGGHPSRLLRRSCASTCSHQNASQTNLQRRRSTHKPHHRLRSSSPICRVPCWAAWCPTGEMILSRLFLRRLSPAKRNWLGHRDWPQSLSHS